MIARLYNTWPRGQLFGFLYGVRFIRRHRIDFAIGGVRKQTGPKIMLVKDNYRQLKFSNPYGNYSDVPLGIFPRVMSPGTGHISPCSSAGMPKIKLGDIQAQLAIIIIYGSSFKNG